MFNEEFYPTPKHVALQMKEFLLQDKELRERYNYRDLYILDPSAGKGDLLDVLKCEERYYSEQNKLFAIELNPDLQSILREKKFKILANDFLSYKPSYLFDVIIMNPPFSNGDEHLLHAWESLENGTIVCLLNSETLNNPYSKTRFLLVNLIKNHGETVDLGNCFSDAERSTNVNITMVKLVKKSVKDKFEFSSTDAEKTYSVEEIFTENSLAKNDILSSMVDQYEVIKKTFVEVLQSFNKLAFYAKGFDLPDMLELLKSNNGNNNKFNVFSEQLKELAWKKIFDQSNFRNVMTEKIKKDFVLFCKEQGSLDFTVSNIENMLDSLMMSKQDIMEACLIEVFDTLTSYDKKNRIYIEGWKTNDNYKVNRTVIIPRSVSYMEHPANCYDSRGDKFRVNYYHEEKLSDIDKVMCYLAGKKFSNIVSVDKALKDQFEKIGYVATGSFENTCQSTYFDIKFFKKGTIHITFKDEVLLNEFNRRAALGKNWLGDTSE